MAAIEVSNGELADKLTIIIIKIERIADAAKVVKLSEQLYALTLVVDETSIDTHGTHFRALLGVNKQLWNAEEELRVCELKHQFSDRFIELARSVYKLNDRRHHIKNQIDEITGCTLREIKGLPSYGK
jgi:uncharacterized protein DUF6165